MEKIYMCIDLKSFYASVECVESGLDPFKTDLVVADIDRNKGAICLAISPKMKSRGIKNRCRIWEIPKNVKPIIAKPRMKKYILYSARIYSIYLKYVAAEDIHPYSIDEMFLDVSGYLKLYGKTPVQLANMIIKDIFKETGITAAAGIGTNLYLAKVALDIVAKHEKTNIGYLNEQIYIEKLSHHKPLTDFWQIGEGTLKRLSKLHINDMAGIREAPFIKLYKEFGVKTLYLTDHARGVESCTIADIKAYTPKSTSISNSQILIRNYNFKEARVVLIEMIDNLNLELIAKGKYTNMAGFVIGYADHIISNLKVSCHLENFTNNYEKIKNALLKEFDYQINEHYFIRKIGVWFGNLHDSFCKQLCLFEKDNDDEIGIVINDIKMRFGKNKILRAISLLDGANQIERNKLIGGHNAE